MNPGSYQRQYANIMDNRHSHLINWVVQQDVSNTNRYLFGGSAVEGFAYFSLQASTWQHLVIVRDADTGNSVYLDGVLVTTNSSTGPIDYDGNQYLSLGHRVQETDRFWSGEMDEVRFYDRVLSSSEIQQLYSGNEATPNTAPLPSIVATPASGEAPLTVTLDGSASTDSDGLIVSYAWSSTDGQAKSGATASMVFSEAGTFTVTLTVTDDDGATDTATQTITVTEAANQAPSADIVVTPTTGQTPLTVSLNGIITGMCFRHVRNVLGGL